MDSITTSLSISWLPLSCVYSASEICLVTIQVLKLPLLLMFILSLGQVQHLSRSMSLYGCHESILSVMLVCVQQALPTLLLCCASVFFWPGHASRNKSSSKLSIVSANQAKQWTPDAEAAFSASSVTCAARLGCEFTQVSIDLQPRKEAKFRVCKHQEARTCMTQGYLVWVWEGWH